MEPQYNPPGYPPYQPPEQEPVKKPKKKRIWWRVLLAFIGGFLLFPIVLAGTTAIAVTAFSTKDVVTMAGGNPDEILGEDYKNKSLLDAVMALVQGIQNNDFQTLEDVSKISPLVEKGVGDLLIGLSESLTQVSRDDPNFTPVLTWDQIKDSNFIGEKNISAGTFDSGSPLVNSILENWTLASILDKQGSGQQELAGILKYLLYPVVGEGDERHFDEEHPYSISYFLSGNANLNNIVNSIVIGDVVGDTSGNALLTAMKNWTLNEISTNINTLTVSQIFSEQQLQESTLLSAISSWSLGNFGTDDQIDSLKIGQLMDLSAAGGVVSKFADFYIGNLRGYEMTTNESGEVVKKLDEGGNTIKWELTEHIMIDDVVDTTNKLMSSFAGKSIADLSHMTMDDLYLKNILDEELYIKSTDPAKADKYNRIIAAIMENERKNRYNDAVAAATLAGTSISPYETWLTEGNNGDYRATINTFMDIKTIENLELGDILDIQENTILSSFSHKTISQLSSITMDEVYLKDLFEKDVYVKSSDPEKASKYNAVIGAIMENERKNRFKESGDLNYEVWLSNPDNAEYKTTVASLTKPSLLDDIRLGDILEIKEGTSLYSFRDKTINELKDMKINDIKLGDFIDRDVYVLSEDPAKASKYNRVIGAIFENERKDRYEQAKAALEDPFTGTYEEWLAIGDNAEYKATMDTLTAEGTIQKLKLNDVINVEGTMLKSFKNKTINELSSITMDDILLRDLFEKDVYVKSADPEKAAKYNRVIGAIMENDNKEAYNAAVAGGTFTGSYAEWCESPEAYPSNAGVLTSQSKIDALKISDVIDTSTLTPGSTVANLINALDEDETANIGNLANKIGGLSIGKLFGLPVDGEGNFKNYADWSGEEKASNPYVMYSLRNSTLNTLSSDLTTLTIGQAMDVTGTIFDKEGVRNVSVSDGNAITSAIVNNVTLGELIDINSSSPKILQQLQNSTLGSINTDIQTFTLGDVIEVYKKDGAGNYVDSEGNPTTDPAKYVYISPIIGALADTPILQDGALQAKLNTLTLRQVLTINESSPRILNALADTNVFAEGAFEGKINTLTLADCMDIYEEDVYKKDELGNYLDADDNITVNPAEYVLLHEKSSPLILSLKDVCILSGDGLTSKLNNIELRDVFDYDDISSNNVLKAIWDSNGGGHVKITNIGAAINNVAFIDILGDDIYETDSSKVSIYDSELNPTGTEVEYNGFIYHKDDTEHLHKRVKASWWFLLTAEGETFTEQEKYHVLKEGLDYKITDLASLVANMEYHMINETLYTLADAGFVNIDRAKLDALVITGYTYSVYPSFSVTPVYALDEFSNPKHVGDCNVSDFLSYAIGIAINPA